MRPPAPPLPDNPFDFDEAIERLREGLEAFETVGEAEDELDASGATILEDAEQLTRDDLTEDEFCFAIPFLIQTWFALVPRGCRAPEINFAKLERAFIYSLRQIESGGKAGTLNEVESFFQRIPQPALMTALMGGFLESVSIAPKKMRPPAPAQAIILALLTSIVKTLDEVLRLN
jgi:hypothetical protein